MRKKCLEREFLARLSKNQGLVHKICNIYGVQKLTSIFHYSSLKSYLSDLEQSYLENTVRIEKRRKKLLWILIIIFIILVFTFILGIIKSVSAA